MMLADNIIELISHQVEKIVIALKNCATGIKFDQRR